MAKPQILECQNQVYKFKLPFSVLCNLRDDGIDFLEGGAWKTMEEDVKTIVPVLQAGIEYAEKRPIDEDEMTTIVDDLMENIGFVGVYEIIMKAISIKGAYVVDDEVENEESNDEELEEKKL